MKKLLNKQKNEINQKRLLLTNCISEFWFSCKPTQPIKVEQTPPAEPKFVIEPNPNDEKNSSVILSWMTHTDFGLSGPAKVAYKVEISTDGVNFSDKGFFVLDADNQKSEAIKDIPSYIKKVAIMGLEYRTGYYFRLTAYNAKGISKSYISSPSYKIVDFDKSPAAEPKFTIASNPNDETRSVILSWASHTNFGTPGPAKGMAYKVEISTDGQNFSDNNLLLLNASDQKSGYIKEIPSTVKSVVVTGLDYNTSYYFKVTAYSANGITTPYKSPLPYKMADEDGFLRAAYKDESTGTPTIPIFEIFTFFNYPTNLFSTKGRYVLLWRTKTELFTPREHIVNADYTELYRINFKNSAAMGADGKFGTRINKADVKNVELLYTGNLPAPQGWANRNITLPNNLLPAIAGYPSSGDYPAFKFSQANSSQYGYFGVNRSTNDPIVAYKARFVKRGVYANGKYEPAKYNDSQIMFFDNTMGKWYLVD